MNESKQAIKSAPDNLEQQVDTIHQVKKQHKGQTSEDEKQTKADMLKAVAVASSAGISLLCSIGGCLWLGYEFDSTFGTSPGGIIMGGIIGGFGGLYMLYKQVVK